jgi:hypothetical protein
VYNPNYNQSGLSAVRCIWADSEGLTVDSGKICTISFQVEAKGSSALQIGDVVLKDASYHNVAQQTHVNGTITGTVPLSHTATVSSSIYTVSADSITAVPYGTTLLNFKNNLTPAAGASFEVYQVNGTTIATDLQTGYKVIVTAEDTTSTKTYIVTVDQFQGAVLTVANSTSTKGNPVTVNISITNPSGTAKGQFDLVYDPLKLTPTAASPGAVISGFTFQPNINFTSGNFHAVRCVWDGSTPITNSGILCTITFNAIETGTSELSLQNVVVNGASNQPIPFTLVNGSVVIDEAIDECFIATAAFGSKFEPSVTLLREFRDQFLMTNSPGRSLVAFYYKNSPPIAASIAGNEIMRAIVRALLAPIIGIVYLLMNPVAPLVLLIIIFAFWNWRIRRRVPQA